MAEIVKQAVIVASILSFILSIKITYDLAYTFFTNRRQASLALLALFGAIVLSSTRTLIVEQIVDLPLWLRIWQLVILVLFIIGQYTLLKEIDRSP